MSVSYLIQTYFGHYPIKNELRANTSWKRMENEPDVVYRETKVEAFSVDFGAVKSPTYNYEVSSAHIFYHDSWEQVGILLVTSFNCGYILSFSNLMLVPLGWTWGIISMAVLGLLAFYANWLLAGFHIIDGQRFIRYRDSMGAVFDS